METVYIKVPVRFLEKTLEKLEETAELIETIEILANKQIVEMLREAEKAGDDEFVEV